jgi:hypothetical protein
MDSWASKNAGAGWDGKPVEENAENQNENQNENSISPPSDGLPHHDDFNSPNSSTDPQNSITNSSTGAEQLDGANLPDSNASKVQDHAQNSDDAQNNDAQNKDAQNANAQTTNGSQNNDAQNNDPQNVKDSKDSKDSKDPNPTGFIENGEARMQSRAGSRENLGVAEGVAEGVSEDASIKRVEHNSQDPGNAQMVAVNSVGEKVEPADGSDGGQCW